MSSKNRAELMRLQVFDVKKRQLDELLSGILMTASFLSRNFPSAINFLETIEPFRAVIGVITLVVGVAFLILDILPPFSDILPLVAAIIAGLVLGIEILIKKPEKSLSDMVLNDGVSSDGVLAQENVQSVAVKAANMADTTVNKVQEVLLNNQKIIVTLESKQIPIGFICISLAILHLLAGGVWII